MRHNLKQSTRFSDALNGKVLAANWKSSAPLLAARAPQKHELRDKGFHALGLFKPACQQLSLPNEHFHADPNTHNRTRD